MTPEREPQTVIWCKLYFFLFGNLRLCKLWFCKLCFCMLLFSLASFNFASFSFASFASASIYASVAFACVDFASFSCASCALQALLLQALRVHGLLLQVVMQALRVCKLCAGIPAEKKGYSLDFASFLRKSTGFPQVV